MKKKVMKLLSSLVFTLALIFSGCNTTKTIYLDELPQDGMETGWGNVEINKTVDGNPLTIAGQKYDRGLGTHAIFKYMLRLDSKGKSFKALVGVDDEANEAASLEFMILGDQNILWKSGIMKTGDPALEIDLDIRKIDKLALFVSDGGDNINHDHADWINARLEYTGDVPMAVVNEKIKPYILTPPVSKKPRINGSSVIGAKPGNDFIYRVPVTGDSPIKIIVQNLPNGLKFNPDSRVISGKSPASGNYNMLITASNSNGIDERTITLHTDKGLCLTPPLGWNSWNCWGLSVDQDKVKAAADAMVNSGLADHGWMYINIDDGWEAEKRTASGELLTNEKFTDMNALSDYCHDYGLRLGIYSSPGPTTCGGFLGSYEHELQDLKTWARWGIDYIKYDWCGYSDVTPDFELPNLKKPYSFFTEQMKKVNRDIVFSICQYGMGDVYEWGEEVGGNLWRTTYDITDTWNSMSDIGFSQDKSSPYAGPGHWNDPDMLVVGQVGWGPSLHPSKLTPDEQYTHISLWALLASPLLIGCDMSQLDDFTLNLLTNDEVLGVNQDPKGEQAVPIRKKDGIEIWVKNLMDGSKAIGIFYTGSGSAMESFVWDDKVLDKECVLSWDELQLKGELVVRDLWKQENLGAFKDSFTTTIPHHGVKLLRVSNE